MRQGTRDAHATVDMANRQGSSGRRARNVAVPDENRPTWRPQDDHSPRVMRSLSEADSERERMSRERDRYRHWDERTNRDVGDNPEYAYRDDPESHYRSAERYGQGQSGYGAGRYAQDPSLRSGSRGNQYYPGGYEERSRERGAEDRFTVGRGGPSWSPHDRSGWSPHDRTDPTYEEDRSGHYLGQGGQEMGEDVQSRYGSQGYQGYRQPGLHRGKGPQGYARSDERIRELVCEALTEDDRVDATNIDVTVRSAEVILSGTVDDRFQKRAAEECLDHIAGVRDIQNQIRVERDRSQSTEHHHARDVDASNGQDKRHRA